MRPPLKKRVVVGAAIHRHGLVVKYMDGNDTTTSDENDCETWLGEKLRIFSMKRKKRQKAEVR